MHPILYRFSNKCRYCYYSDPSDPFKLTDETRRLGLVVCRGTHVSLISPADGMEEIANPFEDEFAEEEEAT
jgi:hypothetical protein